MTSAATLMLGFADKQALRHTKTTKSKFMKRVAVPYNLVLTPQVLVAALAKLPTRDIEDAVEALVAVLDCRQGDFDLEDDPDFEDDDGI